MGIPFLQILASIINEIAVSVLTYQPTTKGTFSVYAKYGDLKSNTLNLMVLGDSPFKQKVLVEDYTGTWCGWCPRLAKAIEMVEAQTVNMVPVAIHCSSGLAYDPFNFSDKNILFNAFDISAFPTATINRTEKWEFPEDTPGGVYQVVKKLQNKALLGVGISSALSNGELKIDIEVGFLIDQTDLKLVVYLLEDKLPYTQVNYTSLYGGTSSIPNFEHNHVLRYCLTDLLGDAIPAADSKADRTYQKAFSFSVAGSNLSNSANIRLVAFVVNGTSKNAINVEEAKVNETVGIQIPF
ncbi:MAG: Omp28-related outer membrane protein [Bacteroidetes bacterium]|nr:Omp28-related outer membrane protein [Bacteroidota bacterium]